MIRKALAAVISAAVVVSACLVPAFRSTAAVALPNIETQGYDAYILGTDGNVYSSYSNPVPGGVQGIARLGMAGTSIEGFEVDSGNSTVTLIDIISSRMDIDLPGWTFIFNGTNSQITNGVCLDASPATFQVGPASRLSIALLQDVSGGAALGNNTYSNVEFTDGARDIILTGEGNADTNDGFELTPEMIDEIIKYINGIIYEEDLQEFENALNAAALNATAANPQVLYFNHGDALPRDLMRTLSSNPNLNVVFHYRYGDKVYQLWINGAQAARFFNEDTKWYGPEWLAAHFPADTSGLFEFEK